MRRERIDVIVALILLGLLVGGIMAAILYSTPARAADGASVTFGPATWAYGPAGSTWQTDVIVANPWPSPVRLDFYLDDELAFYANLEPLESGCFKNVVASAGKSGAHILRIDSAYSVVLHARTANVQQDGNSYGSPLPRLEPIRSWRVIPVGGDQHARRAVYVSGDANVELLGADGTVREAFHVEGGLRFYPLGAGITAARVSSLSGAWAFATVTNERTNAPEVYE